MSKKYSAGQERIELLKEGHDILFEYNGKMYFIDYLYFKKNRKDRQYSKIRSVGEFVGRATTEESRHTYDTVEEMLDRYMIDGKKLRDILFEIEHAEIY